MEDEGNHGNDETRLFILSSLAQHHKSRINCVLCEDSMLVFDRYPLVDGTFFLSPKRHAPDCIEVNSNDFAVALFFCIYFVSFVNFNFTNERFQSYPGQVWRPNTIPNRPMHGLLRRCLNRSNHSLQVSYWIILFSHTLFTTRSEQKKRIVTNKFFHFFVSVRFAVDFALKNGTDHRWCLEQCTRTISLLQCHAVPID